ncbi:hypothetical protein P9B03_01440 [Metasolibacillus meyeri]|uniref:Uncharacterized protein n=1 Tax=Metasolibacillus meyeri TaxID=1071052 RepID=A0AAW9NN14_9BACL|nr:hypothetical protein [Metasolibacillus meyeri]MEC1177134.1 hypothetical protein [Metasolibacillus meyeri]
MRATRFMSDRILVMQHGQLVEEIAKGGTYKHPASQGLHNAILPSHPSERSFN